MARYCDDCGRKRNTSRYEGLLVCAPCKEQYMRLDEIWIEA